MKNRLKQGKYDYFDRKPSSDLLRESLLLGMVLLDNQVILWVRSAPPGLYRHDKIVHRLINLEHCVYGVSSHIDHKMAAFLQAVITARERKYLNPAHISDEVYPVIRHLPAGLVAVAGVRLHTADALGGAGHFPPAHTAYVVLGLYIAGDTLYIQNPGMVVVGHIQPG